MRKIMVMAGLAVLLVFSFSIPVSAQDSFSSDEQALVDLLAAALDQFGAESSYSIEGSIKTAQSIGVESSAISGTLDQTIDQTMNGQYVRVSEDEVRAFMEINQSIAQSFPGQDAVEIEQTLEMVVDGDLYMRFSNLSAELQGMFPDDWVNLTEDPTAFPGAEAIRAEQFTALIGQSQIKYPLNETTVLSIKAVDNIPDVLSGENAQAIQVVFDIQELYEQGALNATLETLDLEGMTAQFGMDVDDFISAFVSDAQMEIIYYISPESRILAAEYVLEAVVPLENIDLGGTRADLNIDQTQTVFVRYSDFGASFDIQAPG